MKIKSLFFIFFLLVSLSLQARKWPGLNYHHVRVFLYNLEDELKGHHDPIKEGKPDSTSFDQGLVLSPSNQKLLEKWLSADLQILQQGLSGCYLPRHAVIFEDSLNKPVAWMSVCFQCEGIRLYFPKSKFKPLKRELKQVEVDGALEQLGQLKTLFDSAGIPVLERPEDYRAMANSRSFSDDELAKMITVEIESDDFINKRLIGFMTTQLLLEKGVQRKGLKVERKEKKLTTAGGDEYHFLQMKVGSSYFSFSGREGRLYLDQAVIADAGIFILKSLGVSDHLEALLSEMVYDGPSSPQLIIIRGEEERAILRFFLKNNVIYRIELN